MIRGGRAPEDPSNLFESIQEKCKILMVTAFSLLEKLLWILISAACPPMQCTFRAQEEHAR